MRTKVVVVPVFQKHWLYHVWSEASAAEAAAEGAVNWTQGSSLQEKAALLGKDLSHKVSAAAKRQWKSLQAADEGTFKNRLYRLAQWVLSKEDPTETFLKSIPREATSLQVIHPTTLKERLVRRRLRRMALAQEHFHNRRILGWALATLPQLPLVITPLPNVTLYYTAYKMMSHYQALQGCRTLRAAFERYDEEERARARAQAGAGRGEDGGRRSLLALLPLPIPGLRRGHAGGGDRGAATREASPQPSTSSGAGAVHHDGGGGSRQVVAAPLPEFHASRELDKVVQPLDRWQSPLPDEMALRVRDLFRPQPAKTTSKGAEGHADGAAVEAADSNGVDALPELVTRLRQQVLERVSGGRSSSCGKGSVCGGKS